MESIRFCYGMYQYVSLNDDMGIFTITHDIIVDRVFLKSWTFMVDSDVPRYKDYFHNSNWNMETIFEILRVSQFDVFEVVIPYLVWQCGIGECVEYHDKIYDVRWQIIPYDKRWKIFRKTKTDLAVVQMPLIELFDETRAEVDMWRIVPL